MYLLYFWSFKHTIIEHRYDLLTIIINDLAFMWNGGVEIVHGKSRHSQSQRSVELAKQDFEKSFMLGWKQNSLENGEKIINSDFVN